MKCTAYINIIDGCLNYDDVIIKYNQNIAKNSNCNEFNIIFNDIVDSLDFSFIGHLILMKKQSPNLSIILIVPIEKKFYEAEVVKSNIIWKLKQYMVHAYYTTGVNVFKIVDSDKKILSADAKKIEWFVLSKRFIPVLYLNKFNYSEAFDKCSVELKLRKNIIDKDILNDKISEENIYQYCREFLFAGIKDSNYLDILSCLAFYRSLRDVRLLRFYMYKDLGDCAIASNRIGFVQDRKLIDNYRDALIMVFNEMVYMPNIYSLIFSVFTSSNILDSKITKDNIKTESNKIIKLWGFTKELIFGLNELAKNIIQHSTLKEGVLSGYIDENNWLKINVFDYGKKGIVETLKENTWKYRNKEGMQSLYAEDYEKLCSSEFKLKDLFEVNAKTFLNQQSKRATVHLGLMIFKKLISENKGRFRVVSCDNKNGFDKYKYAFQEEKYDKRMSIGTSYAIELKTDIDKDQIYENILLPEFQNVENALSVEEMLNFECYNEFEEKTKKRIIDIKIKNNKKEIDSDLWNQFETNCQIRDLKKSIVSINFEELSEEIDGSQLFRFIGKWEIENPLINLIIYNIPVDVYLDLININKLFVGVKGNNIYPFWNDSSLVIVYSYLYLDKDRKVYFCDALWGRTERDFEVINKIIRKNNYNAISYGFRGCNLSDCNVNTIKNEMFFNGRTFLPFDLIIKSGNESIFEINSKSLLCSELKDIYSVSSMSDDVKLNIIRYFYGQSGFKISDSHFRLGSKIHISDFYYAKRFFQNSFFSSKFAFIVARYIVNSCFKDDNIKKYKKEGITLVGYGMYSELLMSIIIKYIDLYLSNHAIDIKINHTLFSDTEDLNLMKGHVVLNNNYIIIVPISTTFSTAIKIEEKIKQKFKDSKECICPHINILHISNGDIRNRKEYDEESIEAKYGWKEHNLNNKTVTVLSFFDDRIKTQKYFLSLQSKWYSIEECIKCYPQKIDNNCIEKSCLGLRCEDRYEDGRCPLMEKPLFETDKASVTTPALILGYPMPRIMRPEDKKRKVQLTNMSLQWGHLIRNNSHFNINICDEVFLSENKKSVINWLNQILINNDNDYGFQVKPSDNVLIVAPKHFSNTVFVNLVNELLFSNSANILHYDFNTNSIENFQVFYKRTIDDSDVVIFVDDSIITGSTFIKCNDYLKVMRDENSSYGFDYAIFLINRMDYYSNKNVLRKLESINRLYSYANLNLPSIGGKKYNCRLCYEKEKAFKMLNESFHVRLKYLYHKRIEELKIVSLSEDYDNDLPIYKPFQNTEEYIALVEVVHRLFQYFGEKDNIETFISQDNIDVWVKNFIEKTESPFYCSYIEKKRDCSFESFPVDIIFRGFEYPPFDAYKQIRERVFSWLVDSFNKKIELIKSKGIENLKYGDFRELKFYIRRASLIGSNYIISNRFFGFLAILYGSGRLNEIREEAEFEKKKYMISDENNLFKNIIDEKESIKKNINDFTDYLVMQIKELLYLNESKCIVLEKVIIKINECNKQLSDEFKQLLRILMVENGVIIKRYLDFYLKLNKNQNNSDVRHNRYYQYPLLKEFFSVTGESSPERNYVFNKYLQIMQYLENDYVESPVHKLLELKTKEICDLIYDLVFETSDVIDSGAYMLIKYDSNSEKSLLDTAVLAYNKGVAVSDVMNSWFESNSYIADFVMGVRNDENDYYVTIDLIEKTENGWESRYRKIKRDIKINYLYKCDYIKYVLIIRLSIKKMTEDAEMNVLSQGVLVLYSNKACFTPIKTRYIMLLRESLAKFINKHHKSNEFRDWKEKSQQLEFITALSHDSDVYKTIFYNICKGIKDPDLQYSLEVIGVLMLNKLFIIKFIKDYAEEKSVEKAMSRNKVRKLEYTVDGLYENLKRYAKIIFSFKHDMYNIIPESDYNLIVETNNGNKITVWSMIFDDIIFEVLFNIRKVYSDYVGKYINIQNKLIVSMSINPDYIVVKNNNINLIGLTDGFVEDLKIKINDRSRIKGLNLINSLSEILYEKK